MNKRSIVKSVLSHNGYLPINRAIIKQIGLDEAALLAVLVDGEEMFGNEDGWFFCTADTIKDILNIKRTQYESALKGLASFNVFESKLMGVPAKKYFRLNYDAILDILEKNPQFAENQQTCLQTSDNQVRRKPANIYKENNNKESIIVENKQKKLFGDGEVETVDVVEDDGFDTFWREYGFKKDIRCAQRAWKKLTVKERKAAISYIPAYKQECARLNRAMRYPATYLNQATWENEISQSSQTQHQTSGNTIVETARRADAIYQHIKL